MQTKEQVAQNLLDAGCCREFIDAFLQAMEEGTAEEQARMLEDQRCSILDRLHDQQKKLECLDYLRYQFRKTTRS